MYNITLKSSLTLTHLWPFLSLFAFSCRSEFPSGVPFVQSGKLTLTFPVVLVCWKWITPTFVCLKMTLFHLHFWSLIFNGDGILAGWCFSLSTLKMFYCHLASADASEKSSVHLYHESLIFMPFPTSYCSSDLPLTTAFQHFGSDLFRCSFLYLFCRVCWVSWFCEWLFFINFGKP